MSYNNATKVPYKIVDNADLEELIREYSNDRQRVIKRYGNLSTWDVSAISNFSGTFRNFDFNNEDDDVSNWNVSNATNMKNMFFGCLTFNCNLSRWDVSNVVNMDGMFMGCEQFDSPLDLWDVSKVKSMTRMCMNCEQLNQPLNSWNVAQVTNMNGMFINCLQFNQPLNSWTPVNKCTSLEMFMNCPILTRIDYLPHFFLDNPPVFEDWQRWKGAVKESGKPFFDKYLADFNKLKKQNLKQLTYASLHPSNQSNIAQNRTLQNNDLNKYIGDYFGGRRIRRMRIRSNRRKSMKVIRKGMRRKYKKTYKK